MRWRFSVSELLFDTAYKKGKLNTQADAFSKLESLGHTTASLDEDISTYSNDATLQKEKASLMIDWAMADFRLLTHDDFVDTPPVPINTAHMLQEHQNDPACRDLKARFK